MSIKTVSRLRSKPETAKLLGISMATLDRRIADGSINYFKQGWRIAFSDGHIADYLSLCLNAPRVAHPRKERKRRAA